MQPYNFCLALCHLDIRRGSDMFCIPYPGFRRYRASTPGLRYAAHIRGLKFRLACARMLKKRALPRPLNDHLAAQADVCSPASHWQAEI